MLDKKTEYRVNMKLLEKVKKTAIQTFSLLHVAYGENNLSRGRASEWHKTFAGGRENVEDERPGRSVKMKSDEIVEKVRTLVRTGRRLGIRMIAEEMNMDTKTVRQFSTTNLNMKKLCDKIVPQNPTIICR